MIDTSQLKHLTTHDYSLKSRADIGRRVIYVSNDGEEMEGKLKGWTGEYLILWISESERAAWGLRDRFAFVKANKSEFVTN